MSTFRLFLFFFFTVMLSSAAVDVPKDADEILRFSAQKMAGYKSWSADYRQSTDAMLAKMDMTGTMSFKQPGLIRMAADMLMRGTTNKMLMVQGGDRIMWQEMTSMGQKQIMKWDWIRMPTNSPLAVAMKSKTFNPQDKWKTYCESYDYTLVGTGTLNGQPVFVLDGVPKKDVPAYVRRANMHEAMGKSCLSIGQRDGFPYKMEQFYPNKAKIFTYIEYTNVKFDPALPDSLFKYQPRDDANVMDMAVIMKQMAAPPKASSSPVYSGQEKATP